MKFIFFLNLILFTTLSAQTKKQAQEVISAAIENDQCVGIAAAFSVNGSVAFSSAAGYSDLEHKTPFLIDTKNRIASIAKPMTAVAILQLKEKGKLNLEDKISKYLDFIPEEAKEINILQLLGHSSGISAYKNSKEQKNYKNYSSLEDATQLFINRKLLSEPGYKFYYTSYGYIVLGLLIEKVSGQSYQEYMEEHIWNKIDMNNTSVEIFSESYSNKSSLYHINNKGKISKEKQTNLSDRIPAGGIYSTTEDLIKFGNAILNNELVTEESKNLMFTDTGLKKVGNPYGLGWYLYGENPVHGQVYGHNGAQIGSSSFLMLLPEKKAVVVVLSNTSGAMQTISNITVQLFNFIDHL